MVPLPIEIHCLSSSSSQKARQLFILAFASSALVVGYEVSPLSQLEDQADDFLLFFKGVNLDEFDAVCYRFFMERGENLLYQDAVKQIKQHLYRGDEIVVISASIDNWVKPFAESLGINQVLGTQLELSGTGHLTGRFATANCYGEEKVKRLLQLYPDRTQYRLVVYGDSRGDKELLAFRMNHITNNSIDEYSFNSY